jgi:hypothetical protein
MSEHDQQPFTVESTLKLDAAAAAAQAEAEATSMLVPSGTASAGTASAGTASAATGTASAATGTDSPPPGSGRGATILVAASNTSSAGKAAADYVCTGTSETGGDEVTINAAIAAAQGGRVVLLEGIYWRTNPIICDYDYTVLEGQGPATTIAVPISGVSPSGYASIIFGNTRTIMKSAIRHLRVQPQGSGVDLVSGSGHGIAFRCNDGRLEDVTIQSCAGDGWRIGGCTNTSFQVTVTQGIGAPVGLTEETWSVSAVPAVALPAWAKVVSLSYAGTPGNDDSVETVVITATGNNTVTVVRGWDSTPIRAIDSNALLIPMDSLFEVLGTALNATFPGGNGMVIEATVQNSEFIRCVVNGGMKLDTPRGAHGIVAFGGVNKLHLCHPYFNPLNGLHVDCRGVGGLGGMQVTGGEYETNGDVGISMINAYYMQISGSKFYANGSASILLQVCDRTTIDGVNSAYNVGESSTGFQHVFADSCGRTRISGGTYQLGEATAIVINGYSPGTTVQDNTIYGINPSAPYANAIRLSGCHLVDVTGNIVDRPIQEDTAPGGDFNRIWGNRILPTNNATGAPLAGVYTNGPHTVAYENLGQGDKVYSSASTLTAVLRKTHLVSAPPGGMTVTFPGAGHFGASTGVSLASGSQGVALPQPTLILSGAPAYVPIAGQVMVPVTGGLWSFVTYSSIDGAVLSGLVGGDGTTTSGNVYLLPPDGEEFSIAQMNDSDTVTLQAPPGSLINGASSFTLTPRRAYRVMLLGGNWSAY